MWGKKHVIQIMIWLCQRWKKDFDEKNSAKQKRTKQMNIYRKYFSHVTGDISSFPTK